MNIDSYQTGQLEHASYVLSAVAQDLIDKGQANWSLAQFTPEALAQELEPQTLITAYFGQQAVGAFVLTFHDPLVWAEIEPFASSFVHKLAVLPQYRGQGLAGEMLEYAALQTLARGIHVTRLDCLANRPKLRAFYKSLGYTEVGLRQVETHRAALFEKRL